MLCDAAKRDVGMPCRCKHKIDSFIVRGVSQSFNRDVRAGSGGDPVFIELVIRVQCGAKQQRLPPSVSSFCRVRAANGIGRPGCGRSERINGCPGGGACGNCDGGLLLRGCATLCGQFNLRHGRERFRADLRGKSGRGKRFINCVAIEVRAVNLHGCASDSGGARCDGDVARLRDGVESACNSLSTRAKGERADPVRIFGGRFQMIVRRKRRSTAKFPRLF